MKTVLDTYVMSSSFSLILLYNFLEYRNITACV